MGGGGSRVPAPDPNAAARQGREDRQTAWHEVQLNNPTEINPWGRQEYSLRPGADPHNLKPGDYISTTTLTPELQAMLDETIRTQTGLAGMQQSALERVRQGLASNNLSQTPDFDYGSIDTSGNAFSAERQRVEDALYNRGARQLQSRFDQENAQRRARLAAMGFDPTSAGAVQTENNAANQQGLQYADLSDRSILAGGSEQSRLLSDQLNALATKADLRGQGISQNTALRTAPLNELSALMSGSQITAPQFSQMQRTNVNSTDIMGQERLNQEAAIAQRNQDVARRNATLTGLATIAGAMFGSPWVGAAVGAYFGSR